MTNQRRTTSSCMNFVSEIGKSSCEHRREQKFRQTPYPLSHKHPLCLLKKKTGDGSQRTVRKPRTNYTNSVFANWFTNEMFASVYYAALHAESLTHTPPHPNNQDKAYRPQ